MPREDDIRTIVTGARARGMTDDQIRILVQRYDERQQHPGARWRAGADGIPSMPPTSFGDTGPMIGSAIGSTIGSVGGGAIGGPGGAYVGGVLGASVGGALGQGAQDVLRGRSPSMADMGTAGAAQGTGEAFGRAMGPGLSAAGRGLYKGGVALLPRTLKEKFPNIAQTGLKEGIALTKRGAAKADREMAGSAATARQMVADAQAAGGAPIRPMEVARAMRPVGQRMKSEAALGAPDETPALVQRVKAFNAQNKGGIPLTRAQELKGVAQDRANSAYKARDRGAVINNNELLTDEAQARGLREAIERAVPGIGAVNTRTQNLIGVRDAAEHASGTGHILSRLGSAGVGGTLAGSAAGALPATLGAAGGLMLGTPGGLTATGLGLTRIAPVAAHTPNAVRLAAILAALTEDVPEQAEQQQ